MGSNQWSQIDNLLQSALERPTGERAQFLREACAGDQALEREVRSLLLAREKAGSFLEKPPINVAAQALANRQVEGAQEWDGQRVQPLARPLPAEIGRYRIVRLLGEGGMGVVYEAVQEHPHRTVALKVVKPGLDASLLRRFEHESQALARLQHPGIAHIYEAGVADTGFGPQPYFAMEFIRGQTLRDYLETHHLGMRERLALMVKICQAVDHAHQRGLIHRDLKPGNILVDETGQPKILDFGVARVADSEAQFTRQTDVGQLVGTLEYMSPEQVLADPEEIDTRSDVYALGVILYEMLAGRRPYRLNRQLHEAVQAIREEDPAPLSSVSRDYRGDIETIVAKALEKDKERRYGSAAALASDIERYLTDEPITARPPSATYHLRKFARRHKALVTGVAAVFVVLVGGIFASTWQARQARQERNRAIAERQRADNEAATAKAVTEFLQNDLLAQAGASTQARPDTKPDPNLTVRTALDRAATRVAGKFDRQPAVEASIRQTIGDTYADLGAFPEAQRQWLRALDLRRQALGEHHPDTLATMNKLALLYLRQGNYAEAERLFATVLAEQRRVIGEEAPDTLDTMNNLAVVYRYQAKYAQAELLAAKVLEVVRRVRGAEHSDTLDAMNNLALLYMAEGKYTLAEPLFATVLEVGRRVAGQEHPDTLVSMNNLGLVYLNEGKYLQAEPLFVTALEARRRVLGEKHPNTLRSMNNLALLYLYEARYAQAEPLFKRALEVQRRVLGEEHPDTLTYEGNLALLYFRQANYEQAASLFTNVLKGRRSVLGPGHPATLNALASLGRVRLQQRKYAEAEVLLREALTGQEAKNPDFWERFDSQSMLGAALADQKKYGEAEPLLLSGYEGLVQHEASIPQSSRSAVAQAGERIIQLYQGWKKPENAAEWRNKIQQRSASARGK
jgi:eukaryotic-like serine/threonine-protein kinase